MGSQPWIKDLPYANATYNYNFKPGESGQLTLEFWITPFDYAGNDPSHAVESILTEHKNVGLSWAIIDYDDVNKNSNNGFWNLSKEHTMFGNASYLLPFKLMPLEAKFKKDITANWSFKIIDMDRRMVAFNDESQARLIAGNGILAMAQHQGNNIPSNNTVRRENMWWCFRFKGLMENRVVQRFGMSR